MSIKRFLNPWQPSFWKAAAQEFRSPRTLVIAALLSAISIAMGSLFIPVTESLRVYFSFLPRALLAAICGPLVGLAAGAVIDLTEFFLFPTGFSFFPGYTLNTMLGLFFYGLFLYRQKPTVLRFVAARTIIAYLINVVLGSLWNKILLGNAFWFYAAKSLVKNTIMIPIEVILLLILFRALSPMLRRMHLVPVEPDGPSKAI